MAQYRCKHCKKIVERKSDKAWIKSYCDQSGRWVHLRRLNENKGQAHVKAAGGDDEVTDADN